MDPTSPPFDLHLSSWLDYVRQLTLSQLQAFAADNIPSTLPLPTDYLNSLNDDYKTIAMRSIALVFVASRKRMVPRQYQLESTNALAHDFDCFVDSGTGSGKTLCQMIPNLLYPTTTSVTISPLKRLQILQAAEFERWGIRVACINEDTPNDATLWERIRDGYFQHLIVQPEQLRLFQGHLPRLARLLNVPRFIKSIARVHVDEAHNHFMVMEFPRSGRLQALSGTFPPHIKTAVLNHLNFDPKTLVSLKLSSNRPNTVYATHRIVGSLKGFRNLDFLISIPFTKVIKCVIFHDDTQQSADAASHLDARLPPNLRNTGLVRHYHGGISNDYLTQVFDHFSNPNGACKILSATEGVSTGLDVEDVLAVVDYGLPQEKTKALQRGGRCGRRGQLSVYLVMAEPWVYTASMESVLPDSTDPDRPISGRLDKNAKKTRPGRSCDDSIQKYLDDVSANAPAISTEWCCDRVHPERPHLRFDICTFFPGRFLYTDDTGAIFAGDVDEEDRVHLNPPKRRKRKAKGVPNRKVVSRAPIQRLLEDWLRRAHAADPLRAVRPASFILDAKAIKTLVTVHQDRMTSVDHVVAALEETEEWGLSWGQEVFAAIAAFDEERRRTEPEPFAAPKAGPKRTKAKENDDPGRDDEEWQYQKMCGGAGDLS
ncbi:P-loop containing nucleoside triphosphate hydrolase protein [Mycena galericulata]|nr:P-loop containing nucleoside triphosphate hydrolase protein [Mycena galericulata]